MPTLVSNPNRQNYVTATAKAIFRQALAETKEIKEIVSDKYMSWPAPCNKTLWQLLVIVGITITVVMGVGFRMMQNQLDTVEAHNELVVHELRELKRYMEAERKLHYYERRK